MKKIVTFLLAAALMVPVLSGCGNSDAKTLNIFAWDGYIPQTVIDSFKEKTGIKINVANFESNEEMLTKVQSDTSGQYDLVMGSDYIIDIARKQGGIMEELDKSKLPNFQNVAPKYLNQYFDPENQYVVPYAAGTPLIVYDPNVVKTEITGYEDLWKPELADSVVMMDDARNVIGITLKTMGKSFNETDPQVLAQAKEKLMKLKPNIRALSYDNPQGLMVSGEASVGYMFTSQVVEATREKPDLKVVYPKEGMGFGIDCMFLPVNAAHKDNAYQFLDYIMTGQVSADIANQVSYLCTNTQADIYLPEDYKTNKSLFIPDDVLGKTEFIQDVGNTTGEYEKIWTEFKQQ
jgi:spermidine/putrescine transport system substrate-binding protein